MIKLIRLLVILPVILLYIGVLSLLLIWGGTFRPGGRVPMLLFPSIVLRIIGSEILSMMPRSVIQFLLVVLALYALKQHA
jgi:hypothetical protein